MVAVTPGVVTTAVVELERSVLSTLTGRTALVGDGIAPSPPEGKDHLNYEEGWWMVRQVVAPTAYVDESYGGQREAMTWVRFAITAAGLSRRAAETMADTAIGVLIDRSDSAPRDFLHPLVIADHVVIDRRRAGTIPTEVLGTVQAGGFVELLIGVA